MKEHRIGLALLMILTIMVGCKKDEAVDWRTLNVQWLEHNRADKGKAWFEANNPTGTYDASCFHETESGLQYYVLYDGVAPQANPESYVYAFYKGSLITGNVFDSTSVTSSQFYLSTLVDGMSEGLAKMKTKAEYVFFIPWYLGYGEDGSGAAGYANYIPPYSTLIFQVQIDACGN